MKYIFYLLALISSSSLLHATDLCTEDPISELATSLSYPNCINDTILGDFRSRYRESLCVDCKGRFERLTGRLPKSPQDLKKLLRKKFFESALSEYKKNVGHNLINVAKIRGSLSGGSAFPKATDACKLKSKEDFLDSCGSEEAKALLKETPFFSELSTELSNDLAKILSRSATFDPTPTLLIRQKSQCFIPESDALQFSMTATEEALTPKLIEDILKLNPNDFEDLSDLFVSDSLTESHSWELLSSLRYSLAGHPRLAQYAQSPKMFIDFLKTVPKPLSPENLRSTIYSARNSEALDENLAKSCKDSFSALKNSLCSSDFEIGNIYLDPSENFSRLSFPPATGQELASTQELLTANQDFLSLCENTSGKLKLTQVLPTFAPSLNPELRLLSLEEYKNEEAESITSIIQTACQMTDESCAEGTIECSIYRQYKASLSPGTLQYKLAQSSNTEINGLLRSMLGDVTGIGPKTREILVQNGILPQEDGSFVDQVVVPERRPEEYSRVVRENPTPATTTFTNRSRRPPTTQRQTSGNLPGTATASTNIIPSIPATASYANNLAELNDLFESNADGLSDIQNEIRRRLQETASTRPSGPAAAGQVAQDVFRSRGHSITPAQASALAERLQTPQNTVPLRPQFSDAPNERPDAAVSDTPTLAEQWNRGQMDRALMGMAGAQQVIARESDNAQARGPASTPDLTKVALNINDEPNVRLSELFTQKITQNDSETQLLKVLMQNRNDFLLQVRGLDFKIIFNSDNTYNMLFQSGDQQRAERIRPQLEMFLNRLRS